MPSKLEIKDTLFRVIRDYKANLHLQLKQPESQKLLVRSGRDWKLSGLNKAGPLRALIVADALLNTRNESRRVAD